MGAALVSLSLCRLGFAELGRTLSRSTCGALPPTCSVDLYGAGELMDELVSRLPWSFVCGLVGGLLLRVVVTLFCCSGWRDVLRSHYTTNPLFGIEPISLVLIPDEARSRVLVLSGALPQLRWRAVGSCPHSHAPDQKDGVARVRVRC